MPEVNEYLNKKETKDKYKEPWMYTLFNEVIKNFKPKLHAIKWYSDFVFDMESFVNFENGLELRQRFDQNPIKAIKIIEDALTVIGNPPSKKFRTQVWLRIKTTTPTINVKDLDTRKLNQLVMLEGVVKSKSADLLGKRMWSKWHCYDCNQSEIHGIYKNQTKSYCVGCKKWRKLTSERDCSVFYIKLDDTSETVEATTARSIAIQILFEQAEAETFNKVRIGSRVKITGILKRKKSDEKKEEYRYYIECRNLELLEDTSYDLTLTSKDIDKFREMALKPTLYADLAQSIAPNIQGHEDVKLACLLQLVGGTELILDGQREERGPIHILLISSPGLGKSQLMKKVMGFLPGSRFTAGKTTSGVGLVAALNRDEDIGGWYVSAGVVPMAHNSLALIDEGDKISKEDLGYLNSAMVDMQVNIDKGGIHATLQTNTAILLACNPKHRVFDPVEPVWKQLGLPKDFLDRFDLIIPMLPPKSLEEKRAVADLVVGKYQADQHIAKPKYPHSIMTKYICYAKKLKPQVTEEVEKYIVENYLNIAKPADQEDSAYFSFRLLTNIVRLSQAAAKLRLESVKISIDDAKLAINLLITSLKKQQVITQDGLMDYEKAEAIVPKSKRDFMRKLKDIILDLQDKAESGGTADYDQIIELAAKEKIDGSLAEELLEKLRMSGDIIQVRRGKYKLV